MKTTRLWMTKFLKTRTIFNNEDDVIIEGTVVTGFHKDVSKYSIPDFVTEIGNGTFENCSSLTEIRIPNSVTEIGMSALSGCSSLEKVYVPKDLDLSRSYLSDSVQIIRD